MPFEQFIPRPFLPIAVQTFAPVASGVYGISNAREWIYIGESDDIQGSLLTHFEECDTKLMRRHPTGFVFEVCDRAKRPVRQERLMLEYEPTCNRHSPQRS
jgi:hypothetical protein